MAAPRPPNLLQASGLPLVYPVSAAASGVPEPPPVDGYDIAVATTVRSLTVMQKEAVVASSGSPQVWRLASDEGPYLQGHDFAPAPLAYMTVGMAADLMENVARQLRAAGLATAPLRLVLDNRFTMQGSMVGGTMVGGALSPEITIATGIDDRSAVTGAVLTGVAAAATSGLLGPKLTSRFSLTSHGTRIPVGRVAEIDGPVGADPGRNPESPPPGADPAGEPIITKTKEAAPRPPDAGVGLRESQHRELHLQAVCEPRPDGVKVIDLLLFSPNGSTFRFLSAEPGPNGVSAAPGAHTYLSAGLGFCFMTQIGRYAKIAREELGEYRIRQETRFAGGDHEADPPRGGRAAAPHTHVFLEPGSDDLARKALDMSEQTCFLHAMCRTELRPKVRTVRYEGS